MNKQKRDLELYSSNIARWFSKDTDALVYYDRKGSALPCTRDEQDNWLAEANHITCNFIHNIKSQRSYRVFLSVAILSVIGPLEEYLGSFAKYLPACIVILLSLAMMCTVVVPRIRYRRSIKLLRNKIERKLIWRNEVAAPVRRYNSFRWVGLIGTLSFWGYFAWVMLLHKKPSFFSFVLISIVYILVLLVQWLSPRMDLAHIRQTGKWFRRSAS